MKFFWPVYLSTLVIGTAGVYLAAPLARPYVVGLFGKSTTEQQQPTDVSAAADVPQDVQRPAPAIPPPQTPTVGTPAPEEDDAPPAMQGVYLAGRGDRPGWGITNQRTTCYKLDGARVGNVAGGVLFDCKMSRQSSKGVMVEGLFYQNGVTNGPYLVSRKDVHLFTASASKLSRKQLDALQAYYALNGKISARKNELLQASAAKNPYFTSYNQAYKTYIAHIEKAKELTAQRDQATELVKSRIEDQLREMKIAETRLKIEYDALHQKFRAWKEQHAQELVKPENDPAIQNWSKEMSALRALVPGLAV